MRLISQEALTFDDVLLVPGESNVLPAETDVSTTLSSSLKLNIPIVSAAMDTVTTAPLAISLALLGGIGVIHKNMSIEAQAEEVVLQALAVRHCF
jgi:IMP dehydrogenase